MSRISFVIVQLKHRRIPSVVKVRVPPTSCPLHTQKGIGILFINCNFVRLNVKRHTHTQKRKYIKIVVPQAKFALGPKKL